MVAIKNVLLLPPKQPYSTLVNLESLYGINYSFFDKADMIFPSVVSERFILVISFMCRGLIYSSKIKKNI